MTENFALEDPNLDADDPVGGKRLGFGIIDVGAQRVKRHTAFTILLDAGDFRTAQTATANDLDAFGTQTHGGLHRALHRTAESHTADQLIGDALRDELGVDFRLADLNDVQLHLAVRHGRQLDAQLFDVRTLLADDNTGTRGIDRNAAQLGRTLDNHLGDRCLRQVLGDVFADLDIFLEKTGIVTPFGVPAAVPGAVDLQAQTDRIALLAHLTPLPLPVRELRCAAC
mmetsp:Transcript_12969/g.42770  ORF Transcript_12969/g.42770 Transcript_12969/m.42770 type:complete len:227 (-) Transcript_12969:1361-2041(-)